MSKRAIICLVGCILLCAAVFGVYRVEMERSVPSYGESAETVDVRGGKRAFVRKTVTAFSRGYTFTAELKLEAEINNVATPNCTWQAELTLEDAYAERGGKRIELEELIIENVNFAVATGGVYADNLRVPGGQTGEP